jgi:hypothetical protein
MKPRFTTNEYKWHEYLHDRFIIVKMGSNKYVDLPNVGGIYHAAKPWFIY